MPSPSVASWPLDPSRRRSTRVVPNRGGGTPRRIVTSRPRRTKGAPARAASRPSTSSASAGTVPATRGTPRRAIAAFSRAMSAIVGPSRSVCSRSTPVTQVATARHTRVGSSLAPIPASTTARSTSARGEDGKRGGDQRVEEGGSGVRVGPVHLRDGRSDPLQRIHERGGVDRRALDPDPLVPDFEMGRQERAGPDAGRREQRLRVERGRPLALRARDVDRRKPEMRIADAIEQRLDGGEPELLPLVPRAGRVANEGPEKVRRLVVRPQPLASEARPPGHRWSGTWRENLTDSPLQPREGASR